MVNRSPRSSSPSVNAASSSSPAKEVSDHHGRPVVQRVAADLGQAPVRRAAEDPLQVDRDDVAGGGVGPAGVEELRARGDEVVGAGADALGVAEDDVGARPQDVQQALHAVDQGRGEGLHALDGDALGQLAEDVGDAGQLVGEDAGALADPVGQQDLAARRRPEPVPGDLQAALVGDLEPADLLDRVAPELDPERVLLGRGEDVEDAAAHRELAAALDQVGAGVGRRGQRLDDVLQRALVAGGEVDRGQLAQALDQRLQHRADRGDDDVERAVRRVVLVGVGQPAQHREPAPDGVAARAEPLVRQRLPGREVGDAVGGQEAAQRGGQVLGLAAGGGHRQQRRGAVSRQGGQQR